MADGQFGELSTLSHEIRTVADHEPARSQLGELGEDSIALTFDPTNAAIAETNIRDAQAAARSLGLEPQ